jgi:hypothetical protein
MYVIADNVGEGQQADKIIKEMKELKEMVKQHNMKWKHDPSSYVSISTLIIPPKFCSLDHPPNPPEPWLAKFKKRYKVVKEVNRQVRDLNLSEGLLYMYLHMQGIKVFKSGTTQHKFDNKPGATQIWRKKLHFTMENKLKFVGFISGAFKCNARELVTGHV